MLGQYILAGFVILFTAIAGMSSVAYMDVVIGLLATFTMIAALPVLAHMAGGWHAIRASLPATHFQVFGDFTPITAAELFLPTCLLMLGNQAMYQKFFSAKSERDASRAVVGWIFGTVILETIIVGIAVVGSALYRGGEVAQRPREVLAYTAVHAFQGGGAALSLLGALLVGAIFAKVVSTANNYLFSPATNLINDVFVRYVKPDAPQSQVLIISRVLVVALGLWALWQSLGTTSVLKKSLYAYTIYSARAYAGDPCSVLLAPRHRSRCGEFHRCRHGADRQLGRIGAAPAHVARAARPDLAGAAGVCVRAFDREPVDASARCGPPCFDRRSVSPFSVHNAAASHRYAGWMDSKQQATGQQRRSVAVFCAAAEGARPEYREAARALGQALAQRGIGLIYGGADVGLMGAVADAALAGIGRVVGVIPHVLVDKEIAHKGVQELHVVDTMHTRKRLMGELADAFLILPGGFGTFEELFEVLAWQTLKLHAKPVVLLNVAGFYDKMIDFLDVCETEGMLRGNRGALLVANSVDEALALALPGDEPA